MASGYMIREHVFQHKQDGLTGIGYYVPNTDSARGGLHLFLAAITRPLTDMENSLSSA